MLLSRTRTCIGFGSGCSSSALSVLGPACTWRARRHPLDVGDQIGRCPSRPRATADGDESHTAPLRWGLASQIASLFSRLSPGKPCDPTERPHTLPTSFGRTTGPRRTSCVGLTAFSPNLERIGCADMWPHYTRI